MKAIVVTDKAAGTAGMKLVERPEPQGAINDVVVQIHASGFTGDELTWPSTWTDRVGRDRTPSIPGHELAGVVTDKCAAGTGRFLANAADVMGLSLDEIGPVSLESRRPVKIATVCTVFVESDILSYLAQGKRG